MPNSYKGLLTMRSNSCVRERAGRSWERSQTGDADAPAVLCMSLAE